MLVEYSGQVVTREQLRNRLWPADTFVDFDHSLNAAVKRLRDALGDSAENPRFVDTVARRGYRFIGPVDNPSAQTPSPTPAIARVEGFTKRWTLISGGTPRPLAGVGIHASNPSISPKGSLLAYEQELDEDSIWGVDLRTDKSRRGPPRLVISAKGAHCAAAIFFRWQEGCVRL
jgi:hypothetical protein